MQRFNRVAKPKVAGDISSVFASLSSSDPSKTAFILGLKEEIAQSVDPGKLATGYRRSIEALKFQINELERKRNRGQKIIPEIQYSQLGKGDIATTFVDEVKQTGSVIVRGVIPKAEAIEYKREAESYAKANEATGYPKKNPQVYEIYWAQAQLRARLAPSMLKAQQFVNSLWHGSQEVCDPSISMSYADRMRIRTPGDQSFALSNHVDGGGIERWQDPEYRKVYQKILDGEWEDYDNMDLSHRVQANMNLHDAPGGCSVFRTYQGWLSLSTTGPNEGTLLVNPFPKESAAYWIARPFFDAKGNFSISEDKFHGSVPGKGQEFTTANHPDLCLETSMQALPLMEPGDAIFWHADVIHAVESAHKGTTDSSVFYIPAVPLCDMNVKYLRGQREDFMAGIPPEDFPGGSGEEHYSNRGTLQDVMHFGGPEGLRSMGFSPFVGDSALIARANQTLFN